MPQIVPELKSVGGAKALAVRQQYAEMILRGIKKIEYHPPDEVAVTLHRMLRRAVRVLPILLLLLSAVVAAMWLSLRCGQENNGLTREARVEMQYPDATDASLVGTYPATAHAGGGYVWDAVLEYRVWCYPEKGAADLEDGSDYYYPFATYQEALDFAKGNAGTDEPIALVLQEEYIDEPEAGQFVHMKERRITEWPVSLLSRPRRTANTIPDFFAPDAPPNRLDIIRGLATGRERGSN